MQEEDDSGSNGDPVQERRRYRRVYRQFSGRLYFPATAKEAPCVIEDISAGGARVTCALSQPPSGPVILYAGNLGRLEGQVVSARDKGFAISFSCSRKRRDRLVDQLTVELNRHLLNGLEQCCEDEPEDQIRTGSPAAERRALASRTVTSPK